MDNEWIVYNTYYILFVKMARMTVNRALQGIFADKEYNHNIISWLNAVKFKRILIEKCGNVRADTNICKKLVKCTNDWQYRQRLGKFFDWSIHIDKNRY
jgi:hypothetical protein